MTKTEFHVMHSELIAYYQFIEMHLRFICADFLADKDRDWFDRLDDYESDPLGLLIQKTKDIQKQKQITILTQDDFVKLDELRNRRNYWVHQCFGGIRPVIFKKGKVKSSEDVKNITFDLNEAMAWSQKLAGIRKPVI